MTPAQECYVETLAIANSNGTALWGRAGLPEVIRRQDRGFFHALYEFGPLMETVVASFVAAAENDGFAIEILQSPAEPAAPGLDIYVIRVTWLTPP